jgi:signal transduction histidine kinase
MDLKKLAYFIGWRSIAFRLHLFVALTLILTVLAVSYLGSRYSIQMMDSQIQQNAAGAAAQWAQDLSRRDAPVDPGIIQKWLLKSKESETYIVRIDIYRLLGDNLTRIVTTSSSELRSLALDEAEAIHSNQPRTIQAYQEKERLIKTIVPFTDFTGVKGCVTVIASLSQSNYLGRIHNQIALFLVPGSVIVSLIFLHLLFTKLLMQRFNRLIAAMNAVKAGNLATRAPEERADEIGIIAQRYNEMMEQIELTSHERDRLLDETKNFNAQLQTKVQEATQEITDANEKLRLVNEDLIDTQRRLTQSERAAVAGQMAAVFAHEIGSPLSAMSTHLQLMAEAPGISKDMQRRVKLIQDQVSRITAIVEELLSETRASAEIRIPVQLNHILQQLLLFLEQHLEKLHIHTETRLRSDLPQIEANPHQIQQVFLNLLNNACDAMPEGGAVVIETTISTDPDGKDYAVISIADNGTGIPKEKQAHIFEPFFTTKDLHRGTGLGLSIAAKIIRRHHGTIELESEVGAGSKFTIRFPSVESIIQQEVLAGKEIS